MTLDYSKRFNTIIRTSDNKREKVKRVTGTVIYSRIR